MHCAKTFSFSWKFMHNCLHSNFSFKLWILFSLRPEDALRLFVIPRALLKCMSLSCKANELALTKRDKVEKNTCLHGFFVLFYSKFSIKLMSCGFSSRKNAKSQFSGKYKICKNFETKAHIYDSCTIWDRHVVICLV